MLCLLLLACALELPQRPPRPPPEVSVEEEVSQVPYPVSGTTEKALRASMAQVAQDIHVSRGSGQHGLTRSKLSWTTKTRWEGNLCGLESATVELGVTVFAPSWDGEGARTELRERWDRYLEALKAHHEGHLEIARKEAQGLADDLRGLEAVPTCEELREAASEAGRVRRERLREASAAFDERTSFGKEQGVKL